MVLDHTTVYQCISARAVSAFIFVDGSQGIHVDGECIEHVVEAYHCMKCHCKLLIMTLERKDRFHRSFLQIADGNVAPGIDRECSQV